MTTIEPVLDDARRFEQDDLMLLRLAGDRLALALDHASAFGQAQRDNLLLQRSLLPRRPAGDRGDRDGGALPAGGRPGGW
jgi:GAF domain-containing protein